ncbi:hypothetical protein HGRIS_003028 [Hohenbuehelia grisea]|uniref:F-box domain-containing protein n=1 Tax=Hohenbuehelia grisea TaxID=104357 RepID=A0ABR3JM94_9AGAR
MMNDADMQLLQQLLRTGTRPAPEVLDVMQSIVSPIRRLPFELLARIILFASEAHSSTPNWTINSKKGPWALGQVCTSWRAVVLTTSALWKNINLEPPRSTLGNGHSIFLLTEALRRSGTCALNITIKYRGGNNESIMPPDEDTMIADEYTVLTDEDTIVVHDEDVVSTYDEQDDDDALLIPLLFTSDRWESFSLDVGDNVENLIELNKQLHGRSLATLQSLELEIRGPLNSSSDQLDFLRSAPLLKRLRMEGIVPECLFIPWLQLEHVVMTVITETQFIEVLRNARNLKSLDCDAPYDWLPDSQTPEHILQSSVRELEMTSLGCRLLEFMTLPNLQKLHLRIWNPSEIHVGHPRAITFLMPFLVRSGCQLSSLVLDYTTFTAAEVATILRALPFLSTLTILRPRPFFDVDVLLTQLGHGQLLPNLRHLHVHGLRWRSIEPILALFDTRIVLKEGRHTVSALENVVLKGKFASSQAMRAILAYIQGPDDRIPDRSWSYNADVDKKELQYQHSTSVN